MFLLQFVSFRLSCHAKNMHSAHVCIYIITCECVSSSTAPACCYCVTFIIEFNVILCQQLRNDRRTWIRTRHYNTHIDNKCTDTSKVYIMWQAQNKTIAKTSQKLKHSTKRQNIKLILFISH